MTSHKSKTGAKINVTKESSPVDEYVTPGGYELEKILNRGSVAYTHVNEVWPNVYIGDEETAKNKYNLKKLGITHVLNAAEGTWNNVDTGAGYYSDMDVVYYGVVAEDIPSFDLSQYFFSAAGFIKETLRNPQNDKVWKRWIDFVKRSYCGEFNITTNNCLCSVHFTPECYSNYHLVKSGFLKSPLMLVSGAKPTLHCLHLPIPLTADKLLVHCVMGRSRSATLFLAYLMICENMTVVDAIEHVKTHRRIIPNWGFLKQLRELDMQLLEKREESSEHS